MSYRSLSLELADFEQIWRGVSNITLDPIKNTVFYFVPSLGAMSSSYMPLRAGDYSQTAMIPDKVREQLLAEVELLCKCAKLSRIISLYTALNFHFTSYGGSLSLTKPVLVIPYQDILRPQLSPFGFEKPEDRLEKNPLAFSDNETRFLLARQIGHLKFNDAFLKTCAKILLIAAVCCLYTTPIGWTGTAAIVAAAMTVYLFADRFYEAKMDLFATKIVGEAIGDPTAAAEAALNALKKMQAQNLERRERNFFCRLYITKYGNNLLDLAHPFLTTRISQMTKHIDELPKPAVLEIA